MALVRYRNVLQDGAGNGIGLAVVTVTVNGTGGAATLYTDAAGLSPIVGNAVTTSSSPAGSFGFYIEPGVYDMTFTKNGATLATDVAVSVGHSPQSGKVFFVQVGARPATLGNHDSILTAFTGDTRNIQMAVRHQISGLTLGQPTTGYLYTPEAYPHYTYLYNSSGYNHSTSSNDGRTAAVAYRVKLYQDGQGDMAAFNVSAYIASTRAGSTDFLANPAASMWNGDMGCGVDGAYMNPYETILRDNGFDVAGIGIVNNFVRTNATGAKSAIWLGYRAQSEGTASCDSVVSATGKWVVGLDLAASTLDFGATKAAISMKGNDRIYFNSNMNASGNLRANWRTTGFEGYYMTFDSVLDALNFVVEGGSRFQIAGDQVTVNGAPLSVKPDAGAAAFVRGLQTGFGLPTGTTNIGTFNTETVTATELARYVKGLVERFHASTSGAHHLIGV